MDIDETPRQDRAREFCVNIGIISDTHDHHANVLQAIELFNERKVQAVLHGGDIVSPFTAKEFGRLNQAQFIAVFGNNEGERVMVRQVVEGFGGEIHDYCYKGKLAGKRVFMTHTPHYVDDAVESGRYDLVVYGHTHNQDIRQLGHTLIVNPGEATDWLTGTGHIVILDLSTMDYEVIPLT